MRYTLIKSLLCNRMNVITITFLIGLILLILWSSDKTDYDPDSNIVLVEGSQVVVDDAVLQELTRASENCQSSGCHEGIEKISNTMDFACTSCHSGDGESTNKTVAHTGMYINPGDLDIAEKTCGRCHPEHVERVKKSLHGTSAGIISASRYTWGAQDRDSIYGNYAVEDDDGDVPTERGAVTSFQQLPEFSSSGEPVDDYLRNQCLRCHLWTEGAKRAGDYRSGGCSACHVLYSDKGGYTGGDSTINKSDPNHPIKHEITKKISAEQCIHCHNRGGRTGVSFIGTMESDAYGTPYTEGGGKQDKLHGKNYNHLSPDVHYERGLMCIDCHTSNDVMGDGNIYGKKEQAVEIECTDCHGTTREYPWDSGNKVKTSGAKKSDGTLYGTEGGNELTNVKKIGDKLILTSKYDGKDHEVPVLKDINDKDSWNSNAGRTAMSSVPHLESLECYSCHAAWAPQCYGCHVKMDEGSTGYDWIDGDNDTNSWSELRSYLRWENPVLGINSEGLVSPFIPGCQVIFTQIDENGNTVELNKIFTTVDGTSGIATNPIQPHTVSDKPRTCESCHTLPKTLGLGSGIYDSSANGLDIDFELERIVDENGVQLQATSHNGARPFNKEEQEKINRVGTCLGCHDVNSDPIWNATTEVTGFAEDTEAHTAVMGISLRSITQSGDPITLFIATDGRDGNIYLKWQFSNSKNIQNYKVYISRYEIKNVNDLTPIGTTTQTSYVIRDVGVDTLYYLAIVGLDSAGDRAGIAMASVKPTNIETGGDSETTQAESSDSGLSMEFLISAMILLVFLVFVFFLVFRGRAKAIEKEKAIAKKKLENAVKRKKKE